MIRDLHTQTEHQLDVSNAHALVAATFPEADTRLGAARLRAVVGLVVTYMENAAEARQS